MNVERFTEELLASGIYSFSKGILLSSVKKSDSAIASEVRKLIRGKKIVKLRNGFYLILPPLYRRTGRLPLEFYVDDFFKSVGFDYYVSLYTASQIHGAGHQKVMQDYISAAKKIKHIHNAAASINFFTVTNWPGRNIIKKKSPAGYYNVSDAALTALDLIQHQNVLGGMNRMLANIEELSEEMTVQQIDDLVSWYPNLSNLQRLGFLLDEVSEDSAIGDQLSIRLAERSFYPVLLVPNSIENASYSAGRWKVDVNIKIDSDL